MQDNRFTKADVVVEKRKNGVEPAIFVFEKGRVYMITIRPDYDFTITDEGMIGERYNELGQWVGKDKQ